ncbi:MAG: hypothetical protein ACRBDL_06670 [Alphaproteobacteria bacterium]
MKINTKTEQFNVLPQKLYAYLSKIENLPEWATSYALEVKKEGDDYKVVTPKGEMYEVFTTDEKTGVIDMRCGPSKDQMLTWPTRVTSDNMGGSLYSVTYFQAPDQSDEEYAAMQGDLDKEFQNIRDILEAA